MALMEIEWHPSDRQLRVFGISGLVASIVATAVLHFSGGWRVPGSGSSRRPERPSLLCSLISPTAARWLYVGLTLVAMPIGIVVSFVLLGAFYFLLLTPLAILFRLIGRDALRRRYEPAAESYWVAHKPNDNMERYLHQF